jgi:hypothetical protein
MAVPTAIPTDRVIAGAVNNVQLHDRGFQQLQRPPNASFWRIGTGQGDQLGLGCPIEDAWPGRGGRMLTDKD